MTVRIDHQGNYAERRREAYPAIGDQLDAIWRALAAIRAGGTLPPEALEMLARIDDVKTRFPKKVK